MPASSCVSKLMVPFTAFRDIQATHIRTCIANGPHPLGKAPVFLSLSIQPRRDTHEVRTHECRRDLQAWREHHTEP